MTKNELIQWLEVYVKAAQNESAWFRRCNDLEEAIFQAGRDTKPDLITFGGLYSFLFIMLTLASAAFAWAISGLSGILVVAAISLVLVFCFSLYAKRTNRERKQKSEKAENRIAKLQVELEKAEYQYKLAENKLKRLKAQGVLPSAYSYRRQTEKFYEYLKNGRADNLKEAINLYVMEKNQDAHYEEMLRHNKAMEAEQSRQTEELKRARQEAERAAETAEQAAKQSHRDSQFNLIAGAVIADAAIKEERQRNETPGMHI